MIRRTNRRACRWPGWLALSCMAWWPGLSLALPVLPDERARAELAQRTVTALADAGLNLTSVIEHVNAAPRDRLARGEMLMIA